MVGIDAKFKIKDGGYKQIYTEHLSCKSEPKEETLDPNTKIYFH